MIQLGLHRNWVDMVMRLVTMVFSQCFLMEVVLMLLYHLGESVKEPSLTIFVLVSSGGPFMPLKI
jgi:hypothetical protein